MNKNTKIQPILCFFLPEKHKVFFEHIFEVDENDVVIMNNSHPIAKMINSMWSTSDIPTKKQDYNVKVYLPITSNNHHRVKYNFIYVPKWKEEQIQLFVESYHKLYLREMFIAGRECGFSTDKIIDAILIDLNKRKTLFTYDQLKKFDYRNRRKAIENVKSIIKNNCI